MNAKEVFDLVMTDVENIALATSINNTPNVRLVSFIYDNNKIYFTSFKGRPKNDEIAKNTNVSFTTLTNKNMQCVRVNNAECKIADVTLESLKNKFIAKMPDFEIALNKAMDKMELYQISFKEAQVTIGFAQNETITL